MTLVNIKGGFASQREWMVQRAKAHAPIFVGNEGASDDEMILELITQHKSWAESSERDEEARTENRRIALMLEKSMFESHDAALASFSLADTDQILATLRHAGHSSETWGFNTDPEWALDEALTEMRLRLWLGRWGASGLPLVKPIDVNWVGAMCATNVASEFLEMLRLPWPAFAIECPPGTGLRFGLQNENPEMDDNEVSLIGVSQLMPTLGERIIEDRDDVYDGSHLWVNIAAWTRGAWKRAAFVNRPIRELGDDLDGIARDEAQYGRCQKMVSKLVAGVLMAMQSGQIRQTSTASHKRRLRLGKHPTAMEFVVGVPVRIRAVDFLREYVSKGPARMRGHKTVQTLVRGHWKHQPYGPLSSLRKFIHIEPYWSGQTDAPIAVRPHILHGAS